MTDTPRNAESFVPPGASPPIPVPGTIANTLAIRGVCESFAHRRKLLAGQTLQSALRLDRLAPSRLGMHQDRKSTRLNSSHTVISYAVFCLKKKKQPTQHATSYPKPTVFVYAITRPAPAQLTHNMISECAYWAFS